MDVVRRISLLVTACLLGIAVMLGAVMSRPAMSANVAKELAAATSFFDSTIVLARVSRPQGPRGDQLAIALGYLERLRLGLGSPFRLADEALVDPRLSATMGTSVAWAVLGRLRRGDAYVVDKSVLDDIGPWTSDARWTKRSRKRPLSCRRILRDLPPDRGRFRGYCPFPDLQRTDRERAHVPRNDSRCCRGSN